MNIHIYLLRKLTRLLKNPLQIVTDGERLLLMNFGTGKIHIDFPATDSVGFYERMNEFYRLLECKAMCDADARPILFAQYEYRLFNEFNYGKEQKISGTSRCR